jgi:hypothetical protein
MFLCVLATFFAPRIQVVSLGDALAVASFTTDICLIGCPSDRRVFVLVAAIHTYRYRLKVFNHGTRVLRAMSSTSTLFEYRHPVSHVVALL